LEGTVPPGSSGLARVRLAQRLPLAPGDRFVLRDTGRAATIGGGRVLDVTPPRRGLRSRAAGLDRRRAALDAGDAADLVAARLAEGPARVERLPAELGLTTAEVAAAPFESFAGVAVSYDAFEAAATRLETALDAHHRLHHLEPGMARPEAVAVLGLPAAPLDELAR